MANDKKGPIPAKQLYSDKPMSKEELAKRAGFRNAHTLDVFQKNPQAFGDPKTWKEKKPDN